MFPFDIDAIFSSAFVIVIVDIITLASQPWDIQGTFDIMDEMMLRGFKIVEPYKKDLTEVDDFRRRLYRLEEQRNPPPSQQVFRGQTANSAVDPILETYHTAQPVGADGTLTTVDGGRGVLQGDESYQSALNFFNYDFLESFSASDMDPCAWMWDENIT